MSHTSLQSTKNIVTIESAYESSSAAQLEERQVLFLQILRINEQPQNIATIDYPYVSPISKKLLNLEYYYLGNYELNPWPVWHAHSGVFEQTFDLWWLRPLHYWDLPKDFFASLFTLNLLGILTFGWKVLSWEDNR